MCQGAPRLLLKNTLAGGFRTNSFHGFGHGDSLVLFKELDDGFSLDLDFTTWFFRIGCFSKDLDRNGTVFRTF